MAKLRKLRCLIHHLLNLHWITKFNPLFKNFCVLLSIDSTLHCLFLDCWDCGQCIWRGQCKMIQQRIQPASDIDKDKLRINQQTTDWLTVISSSDRLVCGPICCTMSWSLWRILEKSSSLLMDCGAESRLSSLSISSRLAASMCITRWSRDIMYITADVHNASLCTQVTSHHVPLTTSPVVCTHAQADATTYLAVVTCVVS